MTKPSRVKTLIVAFFAGAAAQTGTALAGAQLVDKEGVANFGYDVVAYHTDLAAQKGSDAFTASHNGAVFHFASAENRDAFAADPERYAPAYDGHCAYALTRHKKLTVDPEAFSIVDPATGREVDAETYTAETRGVLYLNYSPDVNDQFNAELQDNITLADFAWKDCLELKPAARPGKGFRDLLPGRRPKSCPAGEAQ